jgi:nitrile hydratase
MGELTAARIAEIIERGSTKRRPDSDTPARFQPGDRVRTSNDHPPHHTRLPRYARGRTGEIVMLHGTFLLPDSNAQHLGEKPQHCYAVVGGGVLIVELHRMPTGVEQGTGPRQP